MRPHADTDDRDLADLVVEEDVDEADARLRRTQCCDRLGAVLLGEGEGDVGGLLVLTRDVLHDHVDVDVGLCDDGEDVGGLTDLVGDADDGDLGLAAVMRDALDQRLFHATLLVVDVSHPGARLVREGRADVDRDVLAACIFDAAEVQDLGAVGGHLQHVLVADLGDLACPRHDPRVGGEDTVHVGVDLAVRGVQGGGKGDGRGVGRAASQRRDVLRCLRDALEAGDDDDVALAECRHDAARGDVDDAGVAVGAGGDHARLRAGERSRGRAEVVDGHREEGRAHALAGRQQHVEFPRTGLR